ncbi:MAG TPA: hypothetical protein PKC13_05605, partial [Blastocatellia bacterium]|nr:hypothetical protein [Blastocatellia bacterium]HMY75714.1 hypothetical protein [Blastocatellia bacterium]
TQACPLPLNNFKDQLRSTDGDGLNDFEEDRLANRFAPVIYHGQCEPNYPVSVDWLLARVSLSEYDNQAAPAKRLLAAKLNAQAELLNHEFAAGNVEQKIASSKSYSVCKRTTYFLTSVARGDQLGERNNPADWITYVHSYPNKLGGVTLQYWRGYAYNAASALGIDFSHGGDWEAVAVHLDAALRPATVALFGHTGIEYHRDDLQWEGEHPCIWSEEGGHASRPNSQGLRSTKFTRQETWNGGRVTWWDGTVVGASGGLLNVGERSRPRNQQVFIQYAGLWGAPAHLFITSGYWGPAFNETGALCEDGSAAYRASPTCSANPARCRRVFHKAWCDGMDEKKLDINAECYAARHAP